MRDVMSRIRALSVALILGGIAYLSVTPEPAAGLYCMFCVQSCPSDPQEYCAERGCSEGYAGCQYVNTPGSCFGYTQYQVQCNLI